MTTYRCAECARTCSTFTQGCPSCGNKLVPAPPKLLGRAATPASDQLAIGEELETFDEYMRGLSAEGGQAR